MPSQGDILLVPVPFTDLSTHKQRPVVVVSNDSYNRQMTDVVEAAAKSATGMTRNHIPTSLSWQALFHTTNTFRRTR
jgi:mRNA-degrading endonuclease toxin of MazEF toxin-antitoxin module